MARNIRFLGLAALLVLLGAGCGKSTGTESAAETATTSYRYDFNDSGCDTGTHVFSTLTDVCAGLQNEALNHSCAVAERENAFYKYWNCPGTF
jgi:hypothetical protein